MTVRLRREPPLAVAALSLAALTFAACGDDDNDSKNTGGISGARGPSGATLAQCDVVEGVNGNTVPLHANAMHAKFTVT